MSGLIINFYRINIMKMNDRVDAYPYLQVIILFAGIGSVIGGLIVELCVLLIFRKVYVHLF